MASLWFQCYLCGKEYRYRRSGIYTENVDADKKKSPPKEGVCRGCVSVERRKKPERPPKGV
jgi:hypothetical protein